MPFNTNDIFVGNYTTSPDGSLAPTYIPPTNGGAGSGGGGGAFSGEAVDDQVAALIVAGSGITKVYDDAAGTLTLSATGGGASGGSGLTPVAYSTSIPFNASQSVMPLTAINAATTFTANATGAIEGGGAIVVLTASGNPAHTLTFTGITGLSGTAPYDNRAGAINIIQFLRIGGLNYYQISQPADGAIVDTLAPAYVSAAINPAGSTITITMSEPLLTTSVPPIGNFASTAGTVSAVAISGSTLVLTMSPVVPAGGATVITYTGTAIKDLAGNASAGFATSNLVVANASNFIDINNRQANLVANSVGNYTGSGANQNIAGANNGTASIPVSGDFRIVATPVGNPALSGGGINSKLYLALAVSSALPTVNDGELAGVGIAYTATPYADKIDTAVKTSAAATGVGLTDKISITRTGAVTRAQRQASGSIVWVNLFTFSTTSTADLYVGLGLNAGNNFIVTKDPI